MPVAQRDRCESLRSAALADKERYLTGSGDPRGRSLLALADERGRLTAELKEMSEALQAA